MTETYPLDPTKDVMFVVKYGSHLYGTATPTSDTDLKAIYLPAIDDLLLGRRLAITKTRVDADGVPVPDKSSMPDNGVEIEYIPFQTFVRDFVAGQTYAVEVAFAILKDGPTAPTPYEQREYQSIVELVERFTNSDVYSMVGFAMKQTFDYVHRGERLNAARQIEIVLRQVLDESHEPANLRFDAKRWDGDTVLDYVARVTGLSIGSTTNNNRTMRTLELNGRSYLETTAVQHALTQIKKLIDQYGDRTTRAAETVIDYKSLSHAVRVYQQAIELLDTGCVTFPRDNALFLRSIKQGQVDDDDVKVLLRRLDVEVQEKMKTSTVQKRTPELEAEAEKWLLAKMRALYNLDAFS